MKPSKQPQQSVFAEAWQNMSADMGKILPAKLIGRKRSWKFALALAFIELLVLGFVGKYLYHWLFD